MERKTISKRKRVFSLKPNKNPKRVFVRRYMSHLVQALKKINMNKPFSQIKQEIYEQTMKHEVVDMALSLSCQEFAWSCFLQQKLLPSPHDENPNYYSKIEERFSYNQEDDDGDEERLEINKRLDELQKLLPGGEEINIEEMLSEIGSYIVCLELQVFVLKSLLQDNTY
ncbi:unnamed protein product [Cochlearia groenlandica]